MKYKTVKKANPRNTEQKKYYPIPVYAEEIKIKELAALLSDASTVNPVDVSAVLKAFASQMPIFLQKGIIVDLEGFGRFKLSFSATGEEKEEDVSSTNVTKTRILFTPNIDIKKKMKETSFTKAS